MTTQISSQSASRNPFRPGMGLEPPYLADRGAQLDRFARFLDGFPDFPRNVRLTGLRGVGKTVLLQHFARTAGELGWIVVSREWSEHLGDEHVLALALVEDCRQATEAVLRGRRLRQALDATRQALDFLGSLSVSLGGVTLTIRPRPEREPRQLAIEDQLLAALRVTTDSIASARGRGLVLCYDEAHIVRDSPRTRQFPLGTLIATVARAQREQMPVMLVLCGLPSLTENLVRAKSYTERMFQAEELERLHPPEDVKAFTRPLVTAARAWDSELAASVVDDAAGYPFFIQFFGALLWESASWPDRLGQDAYLEQRPQILAALDRAFFDARLARTSPFERRLLLAVANEGESASLRTVVARLGISNGAVQRTILGLVDKGLVFRPERGTVAFAVPLFGEYLHRRKAGGG